MEHDFFIVGNIAHQALELFHKRFIEVKSWKKNMSVAFKEAVYSQKAYQKIKDGLLTVEHLYDVKQMLLNYLCHLRLGAPVNIFKLEQFAKLTIKGVPVGLKADRIDFRPNGGYIVIDYKTSKNPASTKEEMESVQLPSYGIWIRDKLRKMDKLEGAYYYLRFIKTKRGIHSYAVTDEWMEQAANRYAQVYGVIQNGCKYTKTIDKQACRYCDYRLPCASNFGFN
jgi:CRISPR/Cas system-associated exonuclease Cas4 (RecB family)